MHFVLLELCLTGILLFQLSLNAFLARFPVIFDGILLCFSLFVKEFKKFKGVLVRFQKV